MSDPNLLLSPDYSLGLLSKSSPSQSFQFKRSRTQSIPATSATSNNNNTISDNLYASSPQKTVSSGLNNNSNNNNKQSNLSHVPCKFFKQGTCTAGANCTFSHNSDLSSESAVCKYFIKGNCKFGTKCALLHTMSPYGTSAGTIGIKTNTLTANTPPNLSFLGRRTMSNSLGPSFLNSSDPFASSAPAVSLFHQQFNDQSSSLWRNQSPRTNMISADFIGLRSSPRESSDHLLFGSTSSSSSRTYLHPRNNGYSNFSSSIPETNQNYWHPNSSNNNYLNNTLDNDGGLDLNDAMLPSSLNDLFTPTELQARKLRQQEQEQQRYYSMSPTGANNDWLSDNQQIWKVPFLTKQNESLDHDDRLLNTPTTQAINIPGGNSNHESNNYSHHPQQQDDPLPPQQDDEVQFFMEDDEAIPYDTKSHEVLNMTTTVNINNNNINNGNSNSSSSSSSSSNTTIKTPFYI
ncbi:hypothetical protein CU097_012459 [Rhizopus azygosporus]|uniref:C3H1-type domain-containing protein n=1 Tax=Rhizopus azygosporus TaxID=86630 RepID=A0A367K482_RHIAZ|nr:hypothetical protein CU097_012459 [Rhizopus azygosporus]CEI91834.1 Putative Protein cps3 [Rhizopus microsporus]